MNLIERRRGMGTSGGKQQGTLVVYPSGYDNVDKQYGTLSNPNNMYESADSNSYGFIQTTTDASYEMWFYLLFDTSALPQGATIKSASCKVHAYGPSNFLTKTVQMYSSNNAKGTAQNLGTHTYDKYTIDMSDWTAGELHDVRIKFYGHKNSTDTTKRNISIYGATLTINYEY